MNQGTIQSEVIDLRSLLDGLLVDFAPSMKSRGLTFEAIAFVSELSADPGLLLRLLVTLIDHAMRGATDGTTVTLMASPGSPGYVEFRVAYEGFRLASGTGQKVFAPDATGLQEWGFGLTYCRSAVEAQGGRFWTRAMAAGGVVVCALLPIAQNVDRRGRVHAKSDIQVRAQLAEQATSRTILLVDDEPLMRSFVSRVLKGKGYDVIEADCAERAMDRLMVSQHPLALLLSDVGLRGVSGADLVRQAKLLNPVLPTLLMSGTPKPLLVRDGVIRDGTDLLQKPFSIAELVTKLDELAPLPSHATTHAS